MGFQSAGGSSLMTPNWGLPSDDDSYVKYNGSEYN